MRQVESQNTESGKKKTQKHQKKKSTWHDAVTTQTANLNSSLNKKQKLFVSTSQSRLYVLASVKK